MDFWKSIFKTSIVSLLNRIFTIGVRFISIPIVFNYLGPYQFGIWVTISSFLGYFLLLDFGLSTSEINKFNNLYLESRKSERDLLFSVILNSLLILSLIAIFIGLIVFYSVDWMSFFKLPMSIPEAEVKISILMMIVIFALQLPMNFIQKIPFTFNKGYIVELYQLIGSFVSILFLLGSIKYDLGLSYTILSLNVVTLVSPICTYIYLIRKSNISHRKTTLDTLIINLKPLINNSSYHFVLQAIAILMLALPFLILNYYGGVIYVTPFSILMQVVMAIQLPFTTAFQPMWTKITELIALRRHKEMNIRIKNYICAVALYCPIVVIFFSFFLEPCLKYLLSYNFEISPTVMVVYIIWTITGLLGGGGLGVLLISLDLVKKLTFVALSQLIIFVILSVLLVPEYKHIGIVIAILAGYMISIPICTILIRTRISSLKY